MRRCLHSSGRACLLDVWGSSSSLLGEHSQGCLCHNNPLRPYPKIRPLRMTCCGGRHCHVWLRLLLLAGSSENSPRHALTWRPRVPRTSCDPGPAMAPPMSPPSELPPPHKATRLCCLTVVLQFPFGSLGRPLSPSPPTSALPSGRRPATARRCSVAPTAGLGWRWWPDKMGSAEHLRPAAGRQRQITSASQAFRLRHPAVGTPHARSSCRSKGQTTPNFAGATPKLVKKA